MDLGKLALRGVVGPLFVGHGTQKLFGWFDGHGPDGTGGAFESMGMRPGKQHAIAAGAAETAGGALLTLGALTPVASTLLSSVMITAIRKAHVKNGPWVTNGGWEYPAALIGIATMFADSGPGSPSVDESRFPRFKGAGLAVLSLAAAATGSYLADRVSQAQAPAPQEGQAEAFPSDPGVEEPERRFVREQTTADTNA